MKSAPAPQSMRASESSLAAAVRRIGRLLPHQAPIRDFVSQNKLLAFQHLPFPEALEACERVTGSRGHLPESEYRDFFAAGRITEDDLQAVLGRDEALAAPVPLFALDGRTVQLRDVVRITLLYGIESVSPGELAWRIRDEQCLSAFQGDVPEPVRQRMLEKTEGAGPEAVIAALWKACLERFGLGHFALHPEEMTDLSRQQAETILARFNQHAADSCREDPGIHSIMRAQERVHLRRHLSAVGESASFRDLLLRLAGRDLLEEVRPALIRIIAAHLDEGLAIWSRPDRSLGLYQAWRLEAGQGQHYHLGGLVPYRHRIGQLPERPEEAVAHLLGRLKIPSDRWEGYLSRLAFETPGWAGMVHWRQQHPPHRAGRGAPADLMDFLAIRLFLDSLCIERICRETWNLSGDLDSLGSYFENNVSEYFVRHQLYTGELPEYLASSAQNLIGLAWSERAHRENWRILADMTWTWQHGSVASSARRHTVHGSAWRLFRLAQHLGIDGNSIRALPRRTIENLLATLDAWTSRRKGYLWLQAYEHHYRQGLFNALVCNHRHAALRRPAERPDAQVVFCMDDREEGIRRHLEELNPRIETFGAAGFFGVAFRWQGIDDGEASPLCPLAIDPVHEVREVPSDEDDPLWHRHLRSLGWARRIKTLVHVESRRNLLLAPLLTAAWAPAALAEMAGRILSPHFSREGARKTEPETRLTRTAPAGPLGAHLGFTEAEQADRVEGFLRTIGLTGRFAPLVVLAGHGATTSNNPHAAAYDCGACSGRHGGPNARVFAAMANDRKVRALLAGRGLNIPDDTWFIGVEHDTTSEAIAWFDLQAMPAALQAAQETLSSQLNEAARLSAHERCRRFASAPPGLSPVQALRHVLGRSLDIAQSRPELGHAGNAAALVGRRAATQGVFFDRRLFLISYDPFQDPQGKILENILLAAGPVGAGINLEYFFSRINNAAFGAGSKTQHNIAGLFGVMEGASSDLRTGFPWQMIELHEPMRLQLVVEAEVAVLQAIYERQPVLRELIGNEWLLLNALHPVSGAIAVFHPKRGFEPWHPLHVPLPRAARSQDWYAGSTRFLPPAFTGAHASRVEHADVA